MDECSYCVDMCSFGSAAYAIPTPGASKTSLAEELLATV
eukprot:COSAG01_NODE_50657_length_361_cov_1.370229_2_plen_38_part_01